MIFTSSLRSRMNVFFRNRYPLILALCWMLGLTAGTLLYVYSSDAFVSLMRIVPMCNVSIVEATVAAVLPFLFSAFAVFLSRSMLLLTAALKACVFAFVSMGLTYSFGEVGWLYRLLLLFSDCMMVPVLYFFWLRQLCDGRRFCWLLFTGVMLGYILVERLRICIIVPMLASLII